MLKTKIIETQDDQLITELGIAEDTRTKLVKEELRKKFHKNNRQIDQLSKENTTYKDALIEN